MLATVGQYGDRIGVAAGGGDAADDLVDPAVHGPPDGGVGDEVAERARSGVGHPQQGSEELIFRLPSCGDGFAARLSAELEVFGGRPVGVVVGDDVQWGAVRGGHDAVAPQISRAYHQVRALAWSVVVAVGKAACTAAASSAGLGWVPAWLRAWWRSVSRTC